MDSLLEASPGSGMAADTLGEGPDMVNYWSPYSGKLVPFWSDQIAGVYHASSGKVMMVWIIALRAR